MSKHENIRTWESINGDYLQLCRCAYQVISRSPEGAEAMMQRHIVDERYWGMTKTKLIAELHERDAELKTALNDMKNHEPASVTTDSGVSAHTERGDFAPLGCSGAPTPELAEQGNHPQVATGYPQPTPIGMLPIEQLTAGMTIVLPLDQHQWLPMHVTHVGHSMAGDFFGVSAANPEHTEGEPRHYGYLPGSILLVLSD